MATSDVIAILSLVLSMTLAYFYIRDREHARFNIRNEYTRELLEWHNRVVDILMRFRHLDRKQQDSSFREDLACLSSLIEQGRFYFPNITNNDF